MISMKKSIPFTIAAIVSIFLYACSGEKTEQKQEDTIEPVKIETVTVQSVPQIMTYTATVQPDKRNAISSSMPNRIKKLNVEIGDRVNKVQQLV